MRITNGLIQQRVLRDIQAGMANLAQAQAQVASGKRFDRMSEDPLAGNQVITADRGLRAVDQYRRNSSAARARVDAEESVLNQLTDLITRAKELAMQEGSSTSTNLTRAATADEVTQLIDQAIQLGNTQVGSEYLFAGHQVGVPFDAAGSYFGDSGQHQAEIGQSYRMVTNHNGNELLVSSGVLGSLKDLLTQLQSGTSTTVRNTITGLDGAFTQVQTMLATTGARSRQLDAAVQNTDALESSLTMAKSSAQDVEVEQATLRVASSQTALQAALLSTSRILNTSLTDYLR
jgi:flagellar hook-associated protein 3 FlgL